jgi:antitoxin VapB
VEFFLMPLNIKDPETDRLVRELADLTGKSITDTVRTVVEKELRLERKQKGRATLEELMALVDELNQLPVLDPRSPDEMLYDEDGLPR